MMDCLSKDGYHHSNGHKIEVWSQHTIPGNGGNSTHETIAATAAAWDDCTESVVSNGSSGAFTPSIEEEFTDAENQLDHGLTQYAVNPIDLLLKVRVMEVLISGLFSTASSLKEAYTRVQSAHTPFDVDKLQMADKAVVAELKRFSELKQYYKDRLVILGSCRSIREVETFGVQGEELESKQDLTSYEKVLRSFHLEIQSKCMAIDRLNHKLAHTSLKKKKLERQVSRLEQKLAIQRAVNSCDVLPTPQLLEVTVLDASQASRVFARLLISLMKTAHWDLDAAANSVEPGITYARSKDKKLVFESYIFYRMLNDFESWDFCSDLGGLSEAQIYEHCFEQFQEIRGLDPRESVVSKPGSPFARYCLKKFVELIHPKMEESFFGNMEHRKQVSMGNHPKSQFYQSFLILAKAMWLLHLLAYSFDPPARIFQVKRDTDFSPLYMESIVRPHEMHSNVIPKVGFTVMPGFRVDNIIIKCQVYIAAKTS